MKDLVQVLQACQRKQRLFPLSQEFSTAEKLHSSSKSDTFSIRHAPMTVLQSLEKDCPVVLLCESGGCAQTIAEFVWPLLVRTPLAEPVCTAGQMQRA
eukprot:3168933-Pleurochrysis_carterae.AAC.2